MQNNQGLLLAFWGAPIPVVAQHPALHVALNVLQVSYFSQNLRSGFQNVSQQQ